MVVWELYVFRFWVFFVKSVVVMGFVIGSSVGL